MLTLVFENPNRILEHVRLTKRIITFGGKNLCGVEISEHLKFRGHGEEVAATVIPGQEEGRLSPASRGAGPELPEHLLSGCRATAFQETKLLNRTSSTWGEGWYPPISRKWGEREGAGLSQGSKKT